MSSILIFFMGLFWPNSVTSPFCLPLCFFADIVNLLLFNVNGSRIIPSSRITFVAKGKNIVARGGSISWHGMTKCSGYENLRSNPLVNENSNPLVFYNELLSSQIHLLSFLLCVSGNVLRETHFLSFGFSVENVWGISMVWRH